MSDPILADQFYEGTYRWPKLMTLGHDRVRAEQDMIRYRAAMKRANRFILDDDLTRMVTEVSSTTNSDTLARRVSSAILPYETTWIEFDLHVKVQKTLDLSLGPNRKPPPGVAPRMGILLQRDLDYPTAWAATIVTEIGLADEADPEFEVIDCVMAQPVVYLFDSAKHPQFVAGYRHIDPKYLFGDIVSSGWGYCEPTDEQRELARKSPALALAQGLRYTMPPNLNDYSALSISVPYQRWVHERSNSFQESFGRTYGTTAIENGGMLRWIVTVLAMLAEVPVRSSELQRASGSRLVGTLRRPYMDYHRLSIKLPKTRPLAYIQRKLDKGDARHHRAHEVRSHWRTYVEPHQVKCEHQWLVDDPNGYRLCEKCEAYSRLIKEHVRGDATLGWVRKEYYLETNHAH
jgi:hypothetical protein